MAPPKGHREQASPMVEQPRVTRLTSKGVGTMDTGHLSPEPIIRPSTGFMAARLLGVAVELRVFEILGSGGTGVLLIKHLV